MVVCDKWVALKIVEFLVCVSCLVAKRVSQDDEARLSLLLQKLSREWSLLTSVTWDSVGGAFADAVYGGYVMITFGLLLGRVFQEIPRGRRIIEGFYLGFGMLFFLVIGGLELASLDSVPQKLVVNAAVLGSLSLVVAALFLIDLMGPRTYTNTQKSQTELATSPKTDKKVSIHTETTTQNGNGNITNEKPITEKPVIEKPVTEKQNGHVKSTERPRDLTLDIEKATMVDKEDEFLFGKGGYKRFEEQIEQLEKSKFGSLRNIDGGNYVRLAEPISTPDKLHYEQELAKFNEAYFRQYLDSVDGKASLVREGYLPEPQTPVLKAKASLFDNGLDKKRDSRSPSRNKLAPAPTLQQLEDYLRGSSRSKRADTPAIFPMEPIEERREKEEGRASGTPTDPGYVQYAADRWADSQRHLRTPRHSPT